MKNTSLLSFSRYLLTFFGALLLVVFLAESAEAQERRTHAVRAGETLFSISRTYDVSVEDLRRWNNLSGNQINVGQRLVVSAAGQSQQPVATPPPPSTTAPRESARSTEVIRHRVTSGETLYSISRRYGVPVADIREANRLSGNIIETGQVLEIRGSTQNIIETAPSEDADEPQSPPHDAAGAAAAAAANTTAAAAAAADAAAAAAGETTATGSATAAPDSVLTPSTPGEAITSTPVASAYYTVRRGDTISDIASRNGISVADLMELNRLRSDRLAVGQVLLVRRPQGLPSISDRGGQSTPQGQFSQYEVRRGERLVDVLRQFVMTETELAALNQDININELRQGQTITVLLPPTRIYTNPYRRQSSSSSTSAGEETMESIVVTRYSDTDRGRATTSGDLYNPAALTASHSRLPIGSMVYIENPDTGMGIFVLINDRIIEAGLKLSQASFDALGFRMGARNQAIIRVNER